MGMLSRVTTAIHRAFVQLGDVPKAITYHEAGDPVYTPGGGSGPTRPSTSHAIRGIFTRFRRAEIDNVAVLPSDRRLILDPTEVTWALKVTDWVIDATEQWEVKEILTDARIVPMLHVRRTV